MLKKDQKQVTEKVTCTDLDKYEPSMEVNIWITNKKFTLLNLDRDILLNPAGWLNTSIISAAQIMLKEYRATGQVTEFRFRLDLSSIYTQVVYKIPA